MLKSKLLNSNTFFCLVIFAISSIIGVTFNILTPDFPLNRDTINHYHPIAESIRDGTGFGERGEPTARVAPGYPFFLSLIYRAGGGFEAARIVQIFILAGISLFGYLIAKRFVARNFAFLAALNIAAWPYLLLYSKLILTEVLSIFFLIAAVYALINFYEKPSTKTAILSGAMLGITALTRPLVLLLPFWLVGLALLFAILFRRMRRVTYEWKKYFILLAVFILTLSPWTIRNFLEFNAFIPIAGGLEDSVKRAYERLDYTKGSKVLKPGEATILDNARARLKNIYLFWNPGAGGTNAELLLKQNRLFGAAFLIYKIIFILTVALAALGLYLERKKTAILLGVVILYFWAVHVILYPYPRYTLPIMPLVIILAWLAISLLWNRIRYTLKR